MLRDVVFIGRAFESIGDVRIISVCKAIESARDQPFCSYDCGGLALITTYMRASVISSGSKSWGQ